MVVQDCLAVHLFGVFEGNCSGWVCGRVYVNVFTVCKRRLQATYVEGEEKKPNNNPKNPQRPKDLGYNRDKFMFNVILLGLTMLSIPQHQHALQFHKPLNGLAERESVGILPADSVASRL